LSYRNKHLTVGKVLCPWGVGGQVKVEPRTDNPKRFRDLPGVFIEFKDSTVSYNIESVIFVNDYYPVLKFEGINSRQEAETLRGCYLKIPRKYAVRLPEDHFFICDIIGLSVFDESDTYIGIVKDVLHTGANDVYVVEAQDKKEVLIPAIKQVVKNIDLENDKMVIRPLEGML
jgi:16S rRNA processing protein RimM